MARFPHRQLETQPELLVLAPVWRDFVQTKDWMEPLGSGGLRETKPQVKFRPRHGNEKGSLKSRDKETGFIQIVPGVLCVNVCVCTCVQYVCVWGVLQTCSLGKQGPCREQTQQDSTTNWLLIYGGTAGLIRLANSGEQRERETSISLSLSPTHTHTHINTYLQTPPPPLPVPPWWPGKIITKAGKHDLIRRCLRCFDLSLFSCTALHLHVEHFSLSGENLITPILMTNLKNNSCWEWKFILDL